MPKTIDEAVEYLIGKLSDEAKVELRKVPHHDDLHSSLGMSIKGVLGLWGENRELLKECGDRSKLYVLYGDHIRVDADKASSVIIEALLDRLKNEA
ncbi:MAG: hypothetical protein JXA49_09690 [Actinobacteria bacterium]|nr:hypothetical protein [Actinomycetota bacterium]